jgi:hypothetical protein
VSQKTLSAIVTAAITDTLPCSSLSTLHPQTTFALNGSDRFMISAAWFTSTMLVLRRLKLHQQATGFRRVIYVREACSKLFQ